MISFSSHLVEESKKGIQNKLVSAGMAKHSKSERVGNPNKISDSDFIELIKKTFNVDKVTKFPPLEGPNTSSTYPAFMFDYDGVPDNLVVLAGEVKGRGTKQTEEQEVSWLLVLSALYHNNDLKQDEIIEACMNSAIYSRVYGGTGKALNRNGALGLVQWMSSQPTWVESHYKQASKWIKTFPNTPLKFVKDSSTNDVVQLAKKLFPDAVPDQKYDKDKWNPADVWLYYENLPNYGKLADLNNYLLQSIKDSKGIIGVSLKLGRGQIDKINMSKRPVYEVEDFDLKYGDLFAQNVPTEYDGQGLEGYTVMYRLFDAKATSLIRGEAQKKEALAAQGKVFLKYLDFLMGGRAATNAVAGVAKKIVQEIGKSGRYELTSEGKRIFTKIKRGWPILRDANIIEWGRTANPANYEKLLDEKKFIDYLEEYAKKKRLKEKDMQTRVSARFQTIMLGVVFASLKKRDTKKLHEVALGMLLYGKSESSWSAPHTKAQ